MIRLMRSVSAAAAFASKPENWDICCERLAAPDRVGAGPGLIKRALSGSIKVSPSGSARIDDRHLTLGAGGKGRPDPAQADWLYSHMVRWGQVAHETALARAVREMKVMPPQRIRKGYDGRRACGIELARA